MATKKAAKKPVALKQMWVWGFKDDEEISYSGFYTNRNTMMNDIKDSATDRLTYSEDDVASVYIFELAEQVDFIKEIKEEMVAKRQITVKAKE